MIKAVIFDMDGVLINSEHLHLRAMNRVLQDLGLKITISTKEHDQYVGGRTIDMCYKLKEKYKLNISAQEMEKRKTVQYLKDIATDDGIEPVSGVVDFIKDLHCHGVSMVIASSSIKQVIEIVLDKFNLRQFFSGIVSGDQVEHGKPAPDIFLMAAKLLNMPESSCVVIEDSTHGVHAAKAAGMQCIGFYNPSSGEQDLEGADVIGDDFGTVNFDKINEMLMKSDKEGFL